MGQLFVEEIELRGQPFTMIQMDQDDFIKASEASKQIGWPSLFAV